MLYICEHFYLITVVTITCAPDKSLCSSPLSKEIIMTGYFYLAPIPFSKQLETISFISPYSAGSEKVVYCFLYVRKRMDSYSPQQCQPSLEHQILILLPIRCACHIPFTQARTMATERASMKCCLELKILVCHWKDGILSGGKLAMQFQLDILGAFDVISVPFSCHAEPDEIR